MCYWRSAINNVPPTGTKLKELPKWSVFCRSLAELPMALALEMFVHIQSKSFTEIEKVVS